MSSDFEFRGMSVSTHNDHVRIQVPYDTYKDVVWKTLDDRRVYFTEAIATFIRENGIKLDEASVLREIRDAAWIEETAKRLWEASRK